MHFIKIRSAELPSRILPAIEFIGCLYRKERKTTRLTPQKKQFFFFSPSTCRTIPVEYGCVGHIPAHLWSGSLHRGVRGKCPGVRGAYGMWRSNSVCSSMFAMKWVCIQECSPDWSVSLLFESFWQFLDTKGLCQRAEADSSIFQTIPTGRGTLVISWSKTHLTIDIAIAIKNPRDYSSKPTSLTDWGSGAGILASCIFQRFGSVSQVPWNANAGWGAVRGSCPTLMISSQLKAHGRWGHSLNVPGWKHWFHG